MTLSGFASDIVRPDQLHTVYPLVREAVRGLSLRDWVVFARPLCTPRRAGQAGIVAVRRLPRPLPCGLFIYRRERDLAHGPVLATEYFVAVDVLDPAPVVAALAEEMELLARRLGCTAIRALVREPARPVGEGLRAAGLTAEGAILWKPVVAA